MVPWTVWIDADLYQWVKEITRKVPGKVYMTASDIANPALRDYRAKLARDRSQRTAADILADKDDVIDGLDLRKANRGKPKSKR